MLEAGLCREGHIISFTDPCRPSALAGPGPWHLSMADLYEFFVRITVRSGLRVISQTRYLRILDGALLYRGGVRRSVGYEQVRSVE